MKTQGKSIPRPWRKVRIEEIFAPLEDGRTMHQGWSPQCEKQPSRSEKDWGVLRTTSIQPGEFQPEHNKLLPSKLEPRPLLEVKPGDILITCAGPRIRCGISCLVENTRGRLMISGKMYRFRTRPDEVSAKYVVAFLQSEDAAIAIDGMKTGGSESGLNLTHERFRQLLVPMAPLSEQRRIVGILDEAFEGLATAKANAEQNLQNARALFESHLQAVFTQRGDGWVETKVGAIGKVAMCKRVFKDETTAVGEIPFYKIGTFGKEADAFISRRVYDEYRRKFSFPKKGAVLISAAGTIGRRVRYDGAPAYFQDSNIVWIDNDETKVLNDYLYHFYGACDWNSTKGATISRLYNDNLRQVVVAFPKSLEKQTGPARTLGGYGEMGC